MKVLVPWSGGKDSQASLLYAAEKYGVDNIEAVFCDTVWEHPATYEHIKYVVEKLGVKFVNLRSKKYPGGMVDLAKKRKRFPSTKARFCTTELKIIPMIDYVLSLSDHVLIVQGIRSDESEARGKMAKQCTYFKYYFQPYQTNEMIVDELSKKEKLSLVQKKKLDKAQERLAIGKNDEKFHTYRKKEVFAFCKKYADEIDRPFFDATADEVINFSLSRGYKINPLYFKGSSRVGCYPCIMCTQGEVDLIIKNDPEVIDKIDAAEKYTNSTFFAVDRVPVRYRSQTDKNGKKFPNVRDIERYRKDVKATGDAFANDADLNRCKSVYNICE